MARHWTTSTRPRASDRHDVPGGGWSSYACNQIQSDNDMSDIGTQMLQVLTEIRDDMRSIRDHLSQQPARYETQTQDRASTYDAILETYREVINPRGQMTTKAREKIQVRLSQGYTIEQLCQCLENTTADPYWTKVRQPIAFYFTSQERVEQLLALDIAQAAEAVQEVRDDQHKLDTGCPKCGSDRFRYVSTVWHCESCGHTQQGTPDRHPRSGIDPRDPVDKGELRLGRGPVSVGNLVGSQSRPQLDRARAQLSSGNGAGREVDAHRSLQAFRSSGDVPGTRDSD